MKCSTFEEKSEVVYWRKMARVIEWSIHYCCI